MQNLTRVNQTLYRWIRLGQTEVTIESLLKNRGLRKIALYGFTDLARCMIYELDNSEIEIHYIIDMQGENLQINMPACRLEDTKTDDIDAVICCYLDDGETKEILQNRLGCNVITIEELVYEL